MSRLHKVLALARDPASWVAAATWSRFSPTSYLLLRGLRRQGLRPACIVDVGANVGQFSVAASKLFPDATIHAFEASPDTARTLRDNTAGLPRVTLHECAAGERDGTTTFHVNEHSHSSSVLAMTQRHLDAFPDARPQSVIEVPMRRLDAELDVASLPQPLLLKLDVQGYEARVLGGATELLAQARWVLLEASFTPLYEGELIFSELLALLQGHGFCFLRPVDWLVDPGTGEVLQIDALFGRPPAP